MNVPLDILRCPVTGRGLEWLDPDGLAALDARIAAGGVQTRDGTPVEEPLAAALASSDGRCVYRTRDGILELLAGSAIESDPAETSGLRPEKRSVQAFYDEVGWKPGTNAEFVDTERFVSGTAVMADYNRAITQRIGRHIPPAGTYLLDVGSGPVQFHEYESYDAGYEARICVDISRAALLAARDRRGERRVLIQGDITNLPIRDGAVDCALALNVLYHVPRDEQATGFRELHRVLRAGGVAVIGYTWGSTPWRELGLRRKFIHVPVRAARRIRRALEERRSSTHAAEGAPCGTGEDPELYFHAHDHHWFVNQPWPFAFEIRANHSFRSHFLARFAREGLGGRHLLSLLNAYENRFPGIAGRLGRYPLIIIRNV